VDVVDVVEAVCSTHPEPSACEAIDARFDRNSIETVMRMISARKKRVARPQHGIDYGAM